MKTELLPYIAAFLAVIVFCVGRLAFRDLFDPRAANFLGAMAAGLSFYGFYVYRDEILAGVNIPDGLLPLVLLVVLVLFGQRSR